MYFMDSVIITKIIFLLVKVKFLFWVLNAQVIQPINIKLIWQIVGALLLLLTIFKKDVLTSWFQTAQTINFKHEQAVIQMISFVMNAILEQYHFPKGRALL